LHLRLEWQAKISLEEGLRRTIDFWRKKLMGADTVRAAQTANN
jgi:nucleoside-diphosphate-sugar epimerase